MISKASFLMRQPSAPEVMPTDPFYYDLCCRLVNDAKSLRLFPSYPESVIDRAALCLIGYYQDVIADAGIWRSFITETRYLYGRTVPLYDEVERYMDYELNRSDVRFMVWYALSMTYEPQRVRYPFDEEIVKGADTWFEILEEAYEEAPIPQGYRLTGELEMHSEEDRPAILKLGNWLFQYCYLMTPAYALTLSEISSGYDLQSEDGLIELQKRIEVSMVQDPTGPLALFIGEWLRLIIEGKTVAGEAPVGILPEGKEPHTYYTRFTAATGGKTLQYFATYEEMNRFFISALGWEEGQEHLAQVKDDRDFVLMVDPGKGMLLARNIARCIADPENSLYDKEYAREHAIDLLTVRGCCPGDLLRLINERGWLPDARFPGSDDYALVAHNADFIARCYLQGYYRGD